MLYSSMWSQVFNGKFIHFFYRDVQEYVEQKIEIKHFSNKKGV